MSIGTKPTCHGHTYYERGITCATAMTEYHVDEIEFIVKVPQGLKHVGVLLEPTTVVEKGSTRRMRSSAA